MKINNNPKDALLCLCYVLFTSCLHKNLEVHGFVHVVAVYRSFIRPLYNDLLIFQAALKITAPSPFSFINGWFILIDYFYLKHIGVRILFIFNNNSLVSR